MGEFVRQEIASKLCIDSSSSLVDELMIGTSELEVPPQRIATLVLKKQKMDMTKAAAAAGGGGGAAAAEGGAAAPVAAAADTASTRRRPASSPSLVMNPTFFNTPRIQQASIPAANGFFSARALARFYNALLPLSSSSSSSSSTSLLLGDEDLVTYFARLEEQQSVQHSGFSFSSSSSSSSSSSTTQREALLQGNEGSFHYGFQTFATNSSSSDSSSKSSSSTQLSHTHTKAYGHSGLGGSLAFADPSNHLVVAITVNRLAFNSKNVTERIVRLVYKSLHLPAPPKFEEK